MRNSHFQKLSRLVLALVLVFSLSACANQANSYDNGASEEETIQKAVPSAGVPAQKSQTQHSDDTNNSVDEQLVVRFIDVGEGDCALITCGGQSLLIDGGPAKSSSKVYSVLKTLNLSMLDYIVATHTDADHIGGISGALSYATCTRFFCSSNTSDTKTFTSMVSKLQQQGKNIEIPAVGDSFSLGVAKVTFVGPVQQFVNSDNNGSLVLRIDHGSKSFLFTGDAEEESENAMVSKGADIKADVLKVGHHGSSSSSSMSFLRAVSPEIAVISVGTNSYGHPTDQVLQSLQNIGANILRTDELGTIILKSDGSNITSSSTKGEVNE